MQNNSIPDAPIVDRPDTTNPVTTETQNSECRWCGDSEFQDASQRQTQSEVETESAKMLELDDHSGLSSEHIANTVADPYTLEQEFLYQRYGDPTPIVEVKHNNPHNFTRLRAFNGTERSALAGFQTRYEQNEWMQQQDLYDARAGIVAGHATMSPLRHDSDGRPFRLQISHFDCIRFLNCGWRLKKEDGSGYFLRCHQPEYCPSCNLWERVKPCKREFLPSFGKAKFWFGVTAVVKSDPKECGVKIQTGRDKEGNPIYQHLFRFSDYAQREKLPKFGIDEGMVAALIISESLFRFANWLTDNSYFKGLHVIPDVRFNFFPDTRSVTGVGHTILCHIHAYGNAASGFDEKKARRIWTRFFKILWSACDGHLVGYPDIVLVPATTEEELEKTINYVVKPFKFADFYVNGLMNGREVEGLNLEYHQTVFDVEVLFPCPSTGAKYGNMSTRARHGYIGVPQAKKMTKEQVRRYLERCEDGDVSEWEHIRYENHLKTLARKSRVLEKELKHHDPTPSTSFLE